jgi:subtilase family serine protease
MNMGSARGYITEMAWNDTTATGVGPDNTLSASGGGASIAFPKPSFQTLLTPADKQRDVPDISLSASPNHDGYILCTQGGCVNGYRNGTSLAVVGGTSAGAPTFAGIVAIINQATGSSKGVGNVNSELYTLAGMNSLHAFHDIVGPSSNRVPCTAGSTNCPSTPPTGCSVPCIGFGASVGYDQATGLGSIDALNLVTNWTGVLTTPDFAVGSTPLNLSAPGQSGTATITITAMEGFSGMVNLSFAPCPATAEITCTLSPSSVSVNGSVNGSSATATLSVSTSGPHASARISPADRPGSGWFATGGATLLAGFFVVSVPGRRRRWSGLMGILLLTLVAAGISCGGGSSSPHITDPGTPAGTYTIAVKATSGGVSHTTNVAVTLQ